MGDVKILVYDIETSPYLAYCFGIWDQNIALNQIEKDIHLMAWSAKWYGAPETEIMYMDQRNEPNIENDKNICEGLWSLIDQADVVLTQNGKAFDEKISNARFLLNGLKPPSSYQHIDTKCVAKKYFKFTSNKLEYLSENINVKYKKLKHERFSGFQLWKECLKGNLEAWNEMEKYNKYDVLATEELYQHLAPWDTGFNINVFQEDGHPVCTCGSTFFMKNGFRYKKMSKFQRYACKECGRPLVDKKSLNTVQFSAG